MTEKLPFHLGGHANITHIDCGAFDYLANYFNIHSFLDIGCGTGGMIDYALDNGFEALGIDGDYSITRKHPQNILLHDFTKGIPSIDHVFDLGWSVEFVEHIDEKYINNFLSIFQKCKIIILTHAPKGKGGHHHVNCQNADYWIQKFSEKNLTYNDEITKNVRSKSTMRRNFMRQNGLVFTNSEYN